MAVPDADQLSRIAGTVIEGSQVFTAGKFGFQGDDVVHRIKHVGLLDDLFAIRVARSVRATAAVLAQAAARVVREALVAYDVIAAFQCALRQLAGRCVT